VAVKTEKEKSFRVPLAEYLHKEAWGIEHGRAAMERMEKLLRDRTEKIINLELRGVVRMDSSCSREAIANLIRRHRGERCFFLSGAPDKSMRENMDAAFARQEMTVLLRAGDDFELLGHPLRPHLLQTLEVVEELGCATARQVCDAIKELALTAGNNRLKDLCDAGLILRVDGTAPSGGKEFNYLAVR
jgi:hypothetical protein